MNAMEIADELMVELDMKSTKLFDAEGYLRREVFDWLETSIGQSVDRFEDFKKLPEGTRAWMFECISTTGLSCAYITFSKKSDVTLFVMAWNGVIGDL